MFDPNFQKTLTERTGDIYKPVVFNKSGDQTWRIEAHRERVQREYFDTGVYKEDMVKTQGGRVYG